MIETLQHWIAAHGHGFSFTMFALGIVGLPLPDEWLLAYLGFLVFKGKQAWSRESERIGHILGLGSVAAIGILALYLYLQKRKRSAG